MGKIRKMDLTTTDKKVRKHCNICEKAVTYTTSLGFIDSIRDFIYIVPSDFDNNRCKYLC